ncbi:hypothetical protein BDV24DRAFT_122782, partial [Aspergillus arachidicola]
MLARRTFGSGDPVSIHITLSPFRKADVATLRASDVFPAPGGPNTSVTCPHGIPLDFMSRVCPSTSSAEGGRIASS